MTRGSHTCLLNARMYHLAVHLASAARSTDVDVTLSAMTWRCVLSRVTYCLCRVTKHVDTWRKTLRSCTFLWT
ncbi:hypothetical protein AMTR_s00070p00121510 [Amborella trichopoda]|uniref:Uncharacterized protein n=1 Tax=Amborella trichopoda TaxID=13333 RepID=U5DGK9_AMBTC|nr:hypothetical protein AMTR_s00070p00121510 [Amborella trichopoda]